MEVLMSLKLTCKPHTENDNLHIFIDLFGHYNDGMLSNNVRTIYNNYILVNFL